MTIDSFIFEKALDKSNSSFFVADEKWTVLFCNKNFSKRFNSDKKEVIGNSFEKFLKDKNVFRKIKTYLKKGREWKGVIEVNVDGNNVDRLEVSKISYNKKIYYIGMQIDITAKEAMKKKISEIKQEMEKYNANYKNSSESS